jgi:hypothetical protein
LQHIPLFLGTADGNIEIFHNEETSPAHTIAKDDQAAIDSLVGISCQDSRLCAAGKAHLIVWDIRYDTVL